MSVCFMVMYYCNTHAYNLWCACILDEVESLAATRSTSSAEPADAIRVWNKIIDNLWSYTCVCTYICVYYGCCILCVHIVDCECITHTIRSSQALSQCSYSYHIQFEWCNWCGICWSGRCQIIYWTTECMLKENNHSTEWHNKLNYCNIHLPLCHCVYCFVYTF